MTKTPLHDAAHPLRQLAIRIIENAVEPVLRPQRGVSGEQYYALEDAIVQVLSDDNEPAPEDGGCMYNHDHKAESEKCEYHD
jgi:hypothetical protein